MQIPGPPCLEGIKNCANIIFHQEKREIKIQNSSTLLFMITLDIGLITHTLSTRVVVEKINKGMNLYIRVDNKSSSTINIVHNL